MKAQINRKKINLPNLFFMNYVKGEYQQLIAIFNLVKSKTVKIYSVVQSVKLLLALSIYKKHSVMSNCNKRNC